MAEGPELEAIIAEAQELAAGSGDEAAFRRGAGLRRKLLGKSGLTLPRPSQRLAQALAVELDAAFLGVAQFDRQLDGAALLQ